MPNNQYNSAPSFAKYQGIQNAGKVLQVNQNGIVEPVEIGSELPNVTSTDNGKSLDVVNGEWGIGSVKLDAAEKGAINGVATLDGNGLVPSNQLPSYVDDVLEYASQSSFPAAGEVGKIYVATDTNKSYRWSGSTYVELSSYALATQAAAGLMSAADKTKLDGVATGATANVGTITEITMNGASKGTSGVVNLGTVITSHQDISGKVSGPASATNNAVAIFDGTGGKVIKNSGFTIGKSVPSDAKFTDTTYSAATQSTAGLMSASDKTKLDGISSISNSEIDSLFE